MIKPFLAIAATWLLQGPNDATCTAIYGGDTAPILGVDTPYPIGSRVAPFTTVDEDKAPGHYVINPSGKLFHLVNGVAQPNTDAFLVDCSTDPAIPQEAYPLINQLISLYKLSPAAAKACWANTIQSLKYWMTSDVMSAIQKHANCNSMPLQ